VSPVVGTTPGVGPLWVALAAAGLIAAAACRASPQSELSPTLATVLDEPITVEDFHAALERHGHDGRLEPTGADAQAIAELKLNLLNQLIEERPRTTTPSRGLMTTCASAPSATTRGWNSCGAT
jgi:hypothetical protein